MTKYALIGADNVVVNTLIVDDLSLYEPPAGMEIVASDTANLGDIYADGVFAPPPAPPPTAQELIAHAADRRWRKETGGIAVGGIPIATDDRSKQMIMGARIAADADPGFTTPWVAADGAIHTVDAATVIGISNAVLAHVAACFAIYVAVKAEIDAETITSFAEIDAAFS